MRVGQRVYYIHNNKKKIGIIIEDSNFYYYIGREYLKVDKHLVFSTSEEAETFLNSNRSFIEKLLSWWR